MMRRKKRRRRRFKTTALGTAILLLAAVGIVFLFWKIISFSVTYVKNYIGPPETTDFFENYISPVVMQDPVPFKDASKLSSDWVVKTAIWAVLTSDDNSGKFALTDDNREILPVDDIKSKIASLFGEEYKPHFHTFTDSANQATYEYNAKDNCFYIPEIAYSDYYTPSIRKITRKGNVVQLVVGYISGQGWSQTSGGGVTPPSASKTMLYILRGARGRYRIAAVETYTSPVSSSASEAVSSAADSDVSSGLDSGGSAAPASGSSGTDSGGSSTVSASSASSSSGKNK